MAAFAVDDNIYYQDDAPDDYTYPGEPGTVLRVIEDGTDILYLITIKKSPLDATRYLVYATEDELTVRP